MKNLNLKQEVYDIYDEYVHSKIDRQEFIKKVSVFAVGGLTVPSILQYLLPNYSDSIQIKEDHPKLITAFIEYQSPNGGGKIKAQLSRPKKPKGKLPGVIVVHENRGLNPHIADVARRAAMDGFITLAPDALSPLGGYPGNDDDGRALQRKRDRGKMLEDFIAAFEYLKSHEDCNGKIGVVGFCFGGWISNMMAVRVPDLMAAAPFYGGQPSAEEVPNIKAPLLLHFAAFDQRVNAGWPDYAAALQEHNKEYSAHLYPDVKHGFHNNTTPRYDETAAKLAWSRTIDFFKANLK